MKPHCTQKVVTFLTRRPAPAHAPNAAPLPLHRRQSSGESGAGPGAIFARDNSPVPPSSPSPTANAQATETGEHRPAPSPAEAATGKVAPAQPAKIPLSAYAPVPLARPMSVFGAKFKVRVSTSFTLSLDTVLQAVMDTSLLTFLRTEVPGIYQSFKKLLYAEAGKHRLSEGTKKLIQHELKLLNAPDTIAAALNGQQLPPSPPESHWKLVLQGMKGGESNFVRDIANSLAAWDGEALKIWELSRAGDMEQAHARTEALLRTSLPSWEALNPRLLESPRILILVESSLQTLTKLMCGVNMPTMDLPSRESQITQLLDAGRRPLGHWLHEVTRASDCESLPELAQCLLRAGARHHDRAISPDLLKKWSSSKNIAMPQTALKSILRGVRNQELAKTLESRYYVARFLTFLCDLAWAGIPGEAPVWSDIQAQLKSWYALVYRREAANWPASGC